MCAAVDWCFQLFSFFIEMRTSGNLSSKMQVEVSNGKNHLFFYYSEFSFESEFEFDEMVFVVWKLDERIGQVRQNYHIFRQSLRKTSILTFLLTLETSSNAFKSDMVWNFQAHSSRLSSNWTLFMLGDSMLWMEIKGDSSIVKKCSRGFFCLNYL